jgi:SET domain-containing protein
MLNDKIIRKKTKDKGFGLFAKQKIFKNEIVWKQNKNNELVINLKQYSKLPKPFQKYFYNYGWVWGDEIILPLDTDSFMNHSCNPNVLQNSRTVWRALRDIGAGEEITFDYELTTTGKLIKHMKPMRCRCGSTNCRKWIK